MLIAGRRHAEMVRALASQFSVCEQEQFDLMHHDAVSLCDRHGCRAVAGDREQDLLKRRQSIDSGVSDAFEPTPMQRR
jgi:hypothetical protein